MWENNLFPLRCRQSEFNGSPRKSDNLRSGISQYVSANHPLLFIQQYFANSVHAFIFCYKTTGIGHRKFYYFILNAFCRSRFFRFAHSGNLRIGIDNSRNSAVAHSILFSQNRMYGNFRFTDSRMRQQRESGQITANVDIRKGCLHSLIYFDGTTLCLFQSQVFKSETFRHRTTADAHQ